MCLACSHSFPEALAPSVSPCSSCIIFTQVYNTFTRFESPGTMHKELTFSEFCGDSYKTDISHKFVEYLKLCFRTYFHLVFPSVSLKNHSSKRRPSTLHARPSP